ncbi:ShlB/FhaC/HecB family hemolysin secretion/activation protein [Methylacidimicrobium sp. B4]|uniref:ShlB/FhaC/HecB family hemolysin secretion/activation protein n=1 Tax=Methylacidimicrobium sp. B4 TaxID=2796139 RepID=UPI001A8E72D9|nr:ShlB/FhaC/HecB family hemolysin secretion/activation protein [Methylacidimicrobium sp. B4]QSR84395.1 ShlB/FhaC/HecB family hemolysin secretion/activation protein [Methylacidimicrobium sp. B4]
MILLLPLLLALLEEPTAFYSAPEKQEVVPYDQASLAAKPVVVESGGIRYVVTGNTLLSEGKIADTLRGAKGPEDAVSRLKAVYQRAGYFLVTIRAVGREKRVELEVIEGKITEARVVPSLRWFYGGLTNRPSVKTSDVIRRTANAEAYAARQQERPKVNFEPGTDFASSVMEVETRPIESFAPNPLNQANPWNASVGFGNYGNRFSARYMSDAAVAYRPGYGLELTGGFTNGWDGLNPYTEGGMFQMENGGLSWATPWGVYGVTFANMQSAFGEVTAPLYPEVAMQSWQIYGQQTVYASESFRWTMNERLTSMNFIEDVFQGAIRLLSQDYGTAQLGTTLSQSFRTLGLPAQVTGTVYGVRGTQLGAFSGVQGAPLEGPGVPTANFTYYRGNFSYAQTLPEGMQLVLTGYGQISENSLPIMEYFVLGGMGNLAAWYPGVLYGDTGYITRAALSAPPVEAWGFRIAGQFFAETGGSRFTYTPGPGPAWHYLTDVGLGLDMVHRYGTTISAMAALPLDASMIGPTDNPHGYFAGGRVAVLFVLRQNF